MGDPLAFLHVQTAWGGQTGNPFVVLSRAFLRKEDSLSYAGACDRAGNYGILVSVAMVRE